MHAALSLLLLALIAAGGITLYCHLQDPSRVLAANIATGPGVERLDPAHLVRRAVLADRGCRIDVLKSPGEVEVVTYVEQNGVDGRQPKEPVQARSSSSVVPPSSPDDTTGTWLATSDGYRADLPLAQRSSLEFAFEPAGGDTPDHPREWLGPGVELGVDVGGPWRMLWKRQDGPALHWRETSADLEFRLTGAGGRVARLHADGGPIPFTTAADGTSRIAKARTSGLPRDVRHLRCAIEVTADAISVAFAGWHR